MSVKTHIIKVAVAKPIRYTLDYLAPSNTALPLGTRVIVPFRGKSLCGIVHQVSNDSELTISQLKTITECLDDVSLIDSQIMELCEFASRYYHHPIGEVLQCALPKLLRDGAPATLPTITYWEINREHIIVAPKQRGKQRLTLDLLQSAVEPIAEFLLLQQGVTKSTLNTLAQRGVIIPTQRIAEIMTTTQAEPCLPLNSEQSHAVTTITQANNFQTFLLDGITGSGKTEVYLQAIAHMIALGKQSLVLIPEIGLTPQTLARFQRRFNVPIAIMHSNLNERERLHSWLYAKHNIAKIIIGTRSAIFTPMPSLGLIIIDEEHDASFKQQDTFRYCARNIAIMRAKLADIPIVIGSATPSLTSLYNVSQKSFQHLILSQRAGGAKLPTFSLLDIRSQKLQAGLSNALLQTITQHLEQGNQVLLFINRRGFAPIFLCHSCGWTAKCQHCDAHLTLHIRPDFLLCHHCGFKLDVPKQCLQCHATEVIDVGVGTEKLESVLQEIYPDYPIIRIDRDSTRRKHAMQELLARANAVVPQILIGTQMLAKGHHFPHVTLVGIVNIDNSFYSGDFRASEKLGQLILQVAGRAGREEKPGHVIIQTHQPDNPQLHTLITKDYNAFAKQLLIEREQTHLPPHTHLVLIRVEHRDKKQVALACAAFKKHFHEASNSAAFLLGPIPATMERKADIFRYHMIMQAKQRPVLHATLQKTISLCEQEKALSRVKWSIDVDPTDNF